MNEITTATKYSPNTTVKFGQKNGAWFYEAIWTESTPEYIDHNGQRLMVNVRHEERKVAVSGFQSMAALAADLK